MQSDKGAAFTTERRAHKATHSLAAPAQGSEPFREGKQSGPKPVLCSALSVPLSSIQDQAVSVWKGLPSGK